MSAPPLTPFVFRLGRVGDMIMLTALLQSLHRRYGAPCHVVGAGPWTDSICAGLPEVSRCWTLARRTPFPLSPSWFQLVGALRRSAPGPIYIADYQRAQLRRIRRLLAVAGIGPRRCVFIDEAPGDRGPWVDALLRLGKRTPAALEAAHYPLDPRPSGPPRDPCTPRLAVLAAERAAAQAGLRERGWQGRPLVLIQPGNHRSMNARRRRRWRDRDDKSWPVENWRELLQAVRGRLPAAVLVLRGAVDEIPMLNELRIAIGLEGLEVVGLELRPLFALIEAAHSMISVDTGPAHAAAALGLPVVVLYGAESSAVWLPRGPADARVLGLGGPPVSARADQISVEAVFNAWASLLAACPASSEHADWSASSTAGP